VAEFRLLLSGLTGILTSLQLHIPGSVPMIRTIALTSAALVALATPSQAQQQSPTAASVALAARALDSGDVSGRPAPAAADTAVTRRDSSIQRLEAIIINADAAAASPYAPRESNFAMKTFTQLRDTPQAVTVIGPQLIADKGMRTMAEAVRYAPGVTMGQGEGHRDAPTIRGNSSTSDFFIDGVRDDAQYYRDLYNVERVEALNGPNAMVFGRGGAGGVLNRVSKAADWRTVRRLELQGGSFDDRRVAADFGGPLRSHVAARGNVMYERSTGFRDHGSIERYGMSPTATVLAGRTLLRVGYEHFYDARAVDRGLPAFDGRPSPAPTTVFFGDPEGSDSRMRLDGFTATVQRELSRGVAIRNTTRVGGYDKFYQNVYPGALNAAGTHVSILAYRHSMGRDNRFNQTDLTASFRTGSVGHTLLAGTEFGRQLTTNLRETGFFGDRTSLSVPFDSPTIRADVAYRNRPVDANNRTVAHVGAVYLQDQVQLTDWLQAVAGLRYEKVDVRALNRHQGSELHRADHALSPRFGIVARFIEPVTIYGSYSLSFLPAAGDQLSSMTPSNAALEPEKFANREIGVRWEPTSTIQLSAAAYRLDRTNTAAPDPADASRLVQTGAQQTEGIEVGLAGDITADWSLMAGFTSQRAIITGTTSAAKEGATVPLVPRTTLSLWNKYQVTRKLAGAVGLLHQADMFAAIDNTVTLPGYTRVDAGLYIALRDNLQAQLNVENLLDTRYYSTSHGNNNIMPGSPRTLRLTLTAGK
jgi:catecholate siderophore receptor